MTRNDRKQEELEREARRARRLAERARERAARKVDQAQRAAARAARLAEHAKDKFGSDLEDSIEDFVDEVAEKWTRKAEDWIDKQSEKVFNEGEKVKKAAEDVNLEEDVDQVRASASQAEREADEADELAARAEARADAYQQSPGRITSNRKRRMERDARRQSARELRNRERRRRARRRRHSSLKSRLFSGKGLYRNEKNKKVCGVCAGLAEYLAVDTWKVRLVTVAGAFFVGQIVIPAYFIAYFMLDPKPYYKQVTDRFDELDDFDEEMDEEMDEDLDAEDFDRFHEGRNKGVAGKMRTRQKRKPQRNQPINRAQTLRRARSKFSDIEERLRAMESHVTSSRFELQRELRKISGEG